MSSFAKLGFIACAVTALLAVGCGESVRYAYRPTESVDAEVAGRPASRYVVPPEGPRGTIAITTFGVVEVSPQKDGDPVPMIDVRVVVSNDNDAAPWTVDTRHQILELPGEGKSRAAFVTADAQGSPELQIPPGQKRTIDFYYPLPADKDDEDDVPGMEFVWEVRTPVRAVAGRTPFQRYEVAPRYYYSYYARPWGWGPYYWYDPYWTSVTFVHPVYFGVGYRPYWGGPRWYGGGPHYYGGPRRYYAPGGGGGGHYHAPSGGGRSYVPSHPHR